MRPEDPEPSEPVLIKATCICDRKIHSWSVCETRCSKLPHTNMTQTWHF